VPSLRGARSLVVHGDWTFEAGVTVTGSAELDQPGGRVEAGSSIGG
jgi:UTP--glucose-1-phosphate uridylyltransferase